MGSVDWGLLVPIGVALLGLLGSLLQRQTGLTRTRRRIKADLDILNLLPQESADRPPLEAYISKTIKAMLDERDKRDWGVFTFTITFIAIFGGAFIFLGFYWGGWWWFGAIYGALVILYGVQEAWRMSGKHMSRPGPTDKNG